MRAEQAAHGVWLAAEDGTPFEDNFLDLRPGEEIRVRATAALNGGVTVRGLQAQPRPVEALQEAYPQG